MSSIWADRLDNPLSTRLRDPATTGYAGIAVGAFAAFLAIPPIQARSITWSILVGIVAIALGIWTVTRGRARLGWGGVVAGVVGIGLGILATRSGTTNLNTVFDPISNISGIWRLNVRDLRAVDVGSITGFSITLDASVPEPSSMLLLGGALAVGAGMKLYRRKRGTPAHGSAATVSA